MGEVLGMGVFVIGMGWLVLVRCEDGWIWEYWDNEVTVKELGFECNGWVENGKIDSSVGVFLFY